MCVRGGSCVLCSQVNGARGPARGSRFGAHQGLRVRLWAQGPGCVGGSGRRKGAQVPGISPLRSLPWKLRWGEGRRGPSRGCARGPRLGALAAWGRSLFRAGLREGRGKPSRTGSFGIHSRAVLRSDRCRPRPRTEVGVPSAAEVSAGCVLGPWEHVGTRSLKESWEVTHGDKKTPGNKTGDIRTTPGLGDCGSARSPFPASLHGLCPPTPPPSAQ